MQNRQKGAVIVFFSIWKKYTKIRKNLIPSPSNLIKMVEQAKKVLFEDYMFICFDFNLVPPKKESFFTISNRRVLSN